MLDSAFCAGVNLLEQLLIQVHEEERRKYERESRELEIIADSGLRNQLAAQLLMDRFLAPIEDAQEKIKNTAHHAQYLAESVGYYYRDHGMNEEQAKSASSQFRLMAIKLTESNTLYDLKLVYRAITLFTDQISVFRHHDRKYAIERSIRKEILNPLNDCIATYKNFQRRSELLGFEGYPSKVG